MTEPDAPIRDRSRLDELVDDILPGEWERLVRAYPIPAVLLAAAGGYLLGRYKGAAVVAALSGVAAEQAARISSDFLGGDGGFGAKDRA
ncbi:MAG TPA: hypothetical protein VGS22_08180 [Thermoanaerobaculia bacterium]|jgi:hypothetical protein|nr:hypothetical protein [Thermoanaerobaculia bacterium]